MTGLPSITHATASGPRTNCVHTRVATIVSDGAARSSVVSVSLASPHSYVVGIQLCLRARLF